MNSIDKQYTDLLKDILENGVQKTDRTGTGTISVFGRQIRHNMKDGFPLLTTKKMYFKGIITELLWFLQGRTDLKWLLENDCHIWDGDAIKKWMSSGKSYKFRRNLYIEPKFEILSVDEVNAEDFPYINSTGFYGFEKDGIEELWVNFSKLGKTENIQKFISDGFIYKIKTDKEWEEKWGSLGKIYGYQWRSWGGKNVTNYDLKDVKGSDQYKVVESIKNGEDVTKYGVEIQYQNNSIDQIANLINELKTNPDSRRLLVSAWAVHDLPNMTLPPCHYGFQVYTRELSLEERKDMFEKTPEGKFKDISWHNMNNEEIIEFLENIPTRAISLMWNQRSVDTPLGLPFNIASYGLLLEIIAKMVNMVPDELIGNLGDTHIYSNQIDGVKEQIGRELSLEERINISNFHEVYNGITPHGGVSKDTEMTYFLDENNIPKRTREPFPLPTVKISDRVVNDISEYTLDDFTLENYQYHPTIRMPLSN